MLRATAVERMWHVQDRQNQILGITALNTICCSLLRSEADQSREVQEAPNQNDNLFL